jgi:hypothetical protein
MKEKKEYVRKNILASFLQAQLQNETVSRNI